MRPIPDYRMHYKNYRNPNLVAAYDMSTLVGGDLKDMTGKGNNVTIVGAPTYVAPLIAPKKAKCMEFDGAADWLSLVNPISGQARFAIVFWMFAKGNADFPYSNTDDTTTIYYSAGLNMNFRVGGGTVTTTPAAFPNNQTFMVVCVSDNGPAYIYVDGKPVAYSVSGVNGVVANAFIGRLGSGGFLWEGILDNIMFFDIALTNAQVWELYKSANPR